MTLRLLADIPLRPALDRAMAAFAAETGIAVAGGFDPSPAVRARIAGGEAADLVIVQPDFMAALAARGAVAAAEGPVIGRVGVGLGNRPDAPAHDVSTEAGLRAVLLGADRIVFNRVASGEAFAAALETLGITEVVAPRVIRTAPMDIFAPVLDGTGDDIVAGTMTLLATAPGIRVLGPLPAALQRDLVYLAVPMVGSARAGDAARFIAWLVSPAGRAILAANGVAA
jgi:molybdate transport system substrate-binding protein